ncbi:MAG TPA: enhanced serine sensitivity protein SseB C-terminal domain-containing protein [Terriglobales bacterium]|jgi:hypothetical protein|nr:enhanced serine sensitivity protein SseB C-terminal domain-containing protein [Terriglobales bacterium]
MKWFRQNRQKEIHVPNVTFLGEQDGEVEKEFKQRLLDRFATSTTLHKAYLVRARYGESPEIKVVLALDANAGGLVILRDRASRVFAKMFNSETSLDILFLSDEQKQRISAVAKPFYQK